MTDQKEKIDLIKKIINQGSLRHSKILKQLYMADIGQIDADEIVQLVIKYKYNAPTTPANKFAKNLWGIVDKVLGYIFVILIAGVFAELKAAKVFSGSILENKLKGFGENLSYWIGIKKITVSGPEIISAMSKVLAATPEILKSLAIGIIIGLIGWKIITFCIKKIYKNRRMHSDICKLLSKISPNKVTV